MPPVSLQPEISMATLVGIDQREIFLVLVARRRRNFVGSEIDDQTAGLCGGNAGVIGVTGVLAVIDVEVRAAGIEIVGS